MDTSITNRLLGYPDDARLLLVNADDFGMYGAINEAVVRAFDAGIVRSTSLMTPCPGAVQAMQLLRANPHIRFGVHLSIIRDIEHYYWEPLAAREKVSSLLDEDGHFFTSARMSDMLAQARLDELEVEFRAQIEAALAAQLQPTHLDWHCLHNGGRVDIFDMALALAKEYGLVLRVGSQPYIDQVQRQGLPTNEYELLDSFSLNLTDKSAHYAQMLRDLPAGLTEWAVHPGLGGADAQTIDPDGWPVRQSDLDFLVSAQARDIIAQEGIILIDYAPLQAVWQARRA